MKGRSKFYGKFQMVSPVQIELSLNINGYRKKFNMSQAEFATVCNLCGEGSGVKFSNYDISNYELMNVMFSLLTMKRLAAGGNGLPALASVKIKQIAMFVKDLSV